MCAFFFSFTNFFKGKVFPRKTKSHIPLEAIYFCLDYMYVLISPYKCDAYSSLHSVHPAPCYCNPPTTRPCLSEFPIIVTLARAQKQYQNHLSSPNDRYLSSEKAPKPAHNPKMYRYIANRERPHPGKALQQVLTRADKWTIVQWMYIQVESVRQ